MKPEDAKKKMCPYRIKSEIPPFKYAALVWNGKCCAEACMAWDEWDSPTGMQGNCKLIDGTQMLRDIMYELKGIGSRL